MADPSISDPLTANAFTLLKMEGIGVPPYSARGLKQTLAPIEQASALRRDANGNLVDISFPGFQKYKSTITGDDQRPPNFDGKWPGLSVTIDCVAELSYSPFSESRQRVAVPGSEHAEGDHTVYRPRLQMKIVNLNMDVDEYGCQTGWSLDLEEI